jgi:hypothetical protein
VPKDSTVGGVRIPTWGIEFGQGFLIGCPQPAAAFA